MRFSEHRNWYPHRGFNPGSLAPKLSVNNLAKQQLFEASNIIIESATLKHFETSQYSPCKNSIRRKQATINPTYREQNTHDEKQHEQKYHYYKNSYLDWVLLDIGSINDIKVVSIKINISCLKERSYSHFKRAFRSYRWTITLFDGKRNGWNGDLGDIKDTTHGLCQFGIRKNFSPSDWWRDRSQNLR